MWRPGAPPARPPRAAWPRAAGIALAIAAQGALYLGLRHVAVATWPSWAHHRPGSHGPAPWPKVVSTDIVPGMREAGRVPPLPAPALMPAPLVLLPVPDLDVPGTTAAPPG